MRFLVLLTFSIIITSCDASAQDSLVIDIQRNVNTANDTSIAGKSASNSKMYKQDDSYDEKGEILNNVSHEQNDRKKKTLVRIGIGMVFLVVVIGGWRRRRLTK